MFFFDISAIKPGGSPVPEAEPLLEPHIPASPSAAPVKPLTQHPAPVGQDRTVPLKGVSKAMVKIMTEALKIPPFGYYDEVDVSQLVELRKRIKVVAQQRGIQLTYMPIFIKVLAFVQ